MSPTSFVFSNKKLSALDSTVSFILLSPIFSILCSGIFFSISPPISFISSDKKLSVLDSTVSFIFCASQSFFTKCKILSKSLSEKNSIVNWPPSPLADGFIWTFVPNFSANFFSTNSLLASLFLALIIPPPLKTFFANLSAERIVRWFLIILLNNSLCSKERSFSISNGLVIPSVILPSTNAFKISSGKVNSLKELETYSLDFPSLFAISPCVRENSSVNFLKAFALSTGLRSSRCKFSIIANSNCSSFVGSCSLTTAGILVNPAILDALNLRSPAINSKYSFSSLVSWSIFVFLTTTIGCNTPYLSIESAKVLKLSSEKETLGW